MKYLQNSFPENITSILNEAEFRQFNSFNSLKRKSEYYHTRLLWNSFEKYTPINYNQLGRPMISKGHISISHSRDIVTIGYHPTHAVGVDVEYISQKIRLIMDKFISADDKQMLPDLSDQTITLVWSVKEAVYKMENIPGISFKENIHVKILPDAAATVDVIKENEIHSYEFHYEIRDQFVITCCSHSSRNGLIIF